MTAHVEQLEFQAEARQLLDLLVHSVYSNKDSFLRELISNASDALDKLRLETLRNKDLNVDASDLHIEIAVDKDPRTLTVRDNGIGMTREEVVDLIGTLAKSGTAELRQKLREAKHAAGSEELIGQFGIGFYSTFMVADKVELLTRKAGESDATRWVSSGEGTYTIESVDDAPQGTSVTLHLKPEDAEDELHDYTSKWKIRELVKKYSDFIAWPIRMQVERRTPASEEGAEKGGEERVTVETQTVNSMKALWAKSKDEVSDDEYDEFYKHVAHAWDDPLVVIPMKAEAPSSTRHCCSSHRTPRSTSSPATPRLGCSCISSASSSWATVTSSCRDTCASSRGSSMHRMCRSTFLAKSCSRIGRSTRSVAV